MTSTAMTDPFVFAPDDRAWSGISTPGFRKAAVQRDEKSAKKMKTARFESPLVSFSPGFSVIGVFNFRTAGPKNQTRVLNTDSGRDVYLPE
jgi:hypothetical protein